MNKFFLRYTALLLLAISGLSACEEEKNADVRDMPLEVDFKRLDVPMYEFARDVQGEQQTGIETAYRHYLAEDREAFFRIFGLDFYTRGRNVSAALQDTLIMRNLGLLLQDANILSLLDTIQIVYPVNYPFEEILLPPLKRLRLHFPGVKIPALRTHVNGYVPDGDLQSIDQFRPVEGYMSIGLHYFMGEDFPYYPPQIPEYIRRRFSLEYLEAAFVSEIAEEFVPPPPLDRQPVLVEEMVRAGIRQYFIEQLLPYTPDSMLMAYTAGQMDWAETYEREVYKDMTTELFKPDVKLQLDYLGEKPYSTQYALESAPRLGQYIGWKIVQAYMERHPEVGLAELCETRDFEQIFRESGYKP